MIELKPCPFCGAEAKISMVSVFYKIAARHKEGCYLYHHRILFDTKEEAAETWNRRVDADGMRCAAKIIAKSDWEQEGKR